jgi:hypothetical protein
MDGDTSQSNMAAANADGPKSGVATLLPTPAANSSSQGTPSPAPMFHPDSLVTLLVGPEERKMVVYETYLSRDSPFFKVALKKQWTEGQTRIIKLPEESTDSMQHYIEHVYSGIVPTHSLTAEKMWDTEDKHFYDSLAQLYVLAERVLNAKCQNVVIREIFRLSQLECGPLETTIYPDTPAINIIYQGTTPESPARRLVVNFAVCHGDESWFDDGDDCGYMLDFGKALINRVMVHESVAEFRDLVLKAEDYFVSEDA